MTSAYHFSDEVISHRGWISPVRSLLRQWTESVFSGCIFLFPSIVLPYLSFSLLLLLLFFLLLFFLLLLLLLLPLFLVFLLLLLFLLLSLFLLFFSFILMALHNISVKAFKLIDYLFPQMWIIITDKKCMSYCYLHDCFRKSKLHLNDWVKPTEF